MALKVKVDEDLPRRVVQLLREHGYDAASVIEQNMGGWKDPQLWPVIQKEERMLITADKGFGDIRGNQIWSKGQFLAAQYTNCPRIYEKL